MPSQFFFQRNGKVVGPVSTDVIKKQIRSGKIRTTDQIGSASAGPWKVIGDVPALAKLFEPQSVADRFDDLPDDASQLPPQRQEKKKTPEVTKQRTENGADKQVLSGGVIVLLCMGAVLVLGAGLVFLFQPNSTLPNEQSARLQELERANAVVGNALPSSDLGTEPAETPSASQQAVTQCNKGLAFAEKEDWGTAIACFTEAIRLDPDNAFAYYVRGIAHSNQEGVMEFLFGYGIKANADFAKAKELGFSP